jgi:hypothetical protein
VLSFVILSPNGEYFVRALDLGRLMGDPVTLELVSSRPSLNLNFDRDSF